MSAHLAELCGKGQPDGNLKNASQFCQACSLSIRQSLISELKKGSHCLPNAY
jgi:hypothetical protein